jgi:hypothetical protein
LRSWHWRFVSVYYFGPDVEQDFVFLTPGSVLADRALAAGFAGVPFLCRQFRFV